MIALQDEEFFEHPAHVGVVVHDEDAAPSRRRTGGCRRGGRLDGRRLRGRGRDVAAERGEELGEVQRLVEDGLHPEGLGLPAHVVVGVGADDDDTDGGVEPADTLERVDTAEARHVEIENDRRGTLLLDVEQRLQTVGGPKRLPTV